MVLKGIDAGRTDSRMTTRQAGLAALVVSAMTEHGWAYEIAYRYTQTDVRLHRPHLWSVFNHDPGVMLWADSQASRVATTVETVYRRTITTPVPLVSGSQYAPGTAVSGGTWNLGYVGYVAGAQSSGVSSPIRTGTTGTGPFNPFGPKDYANGGANQFELQYQPNRAPVAPDQLQPNGITPNTVAPTFTGRFSDPDLTINGTTNDAEMLSQYQIQVRDATNPTGPLLADALIPASSNEQATDAFSWNYTGGALTSGRTYEWRARVADHFGTWSDWSDAIWGWISFTLGQVGTLTVAATRFPATDPLNPGLPYTERSLSPTAIPATWHHPDGLPLTAARIQFRQGSSVARDKTFTGLNVANNAPVTLLPDGSSWTNAPTMAPLTRGQSYDIWTSGQDGNGIWAPLQKVASFTGNRQPLTPSHLSPASGLFGSIPTLTVSATDPDDTVASNHRIILQLRRADGANQIQVYMTKRAPAPDGTVNPFWDWTPTLAQLEQVQGNSTGYGDFRWQAFACDTIGCTGLSAQATFTYALLPNPVVTSPTTGQTVGVASLAVTWTVDEQSQRQVTIRTGGSGNIQIQSPMEPTSSRSYTVDLGGLRNRTDYTIEVTVIGAAGLAGTSPQQPFTLSFTPPPALTNVQAVPYAADPDDQPTGIQIAWDPTTLVAGEFTQYVLQKQRLDAPFAGDWETIKVTRSPSDTSWIDKYPATGGAYQYQVWQTKQVGQSQVNSDKVITPPTGVTFTGVVLADVRGISGDILTIASIDQNAELEPIRGGSDVQTWGGLAPVLIEDGTYYRTMRFTANIVYAPDLADTMGQAVRQPVLQQYNRLERLAKWRPDRSPIVLLVRDGSGFAFMGRLTLGTMTRITPHYWKVECTIREVSTDVTLSGAVRSLLANAATTGVSSIVEVV